MNDQNLLDNPSISSSTTPPTMSSDSTNISAETIINNHNNNNNNDDNNNINNNINTKNSLENQSNAMLNSTNPNNHNHTINNIDDINQNSLSNSQISIITKERKKMNDNDINNYENHHHIPNNNNHSNSHLYNIPDNLIIMHNQKNKGKNNSRHVLNDILEVSHNPKINNINNKIIHDNINNNINNASVSSSLTLIPTSKQNKNNKQFPINIILGIIQLLLSCTLTALGGLILARNASFGYAFSGIWAGAICGIAGALGVINIRKIQTGFLAISLICVASSTLALALTGIGLVRDINLNTTKGEISAGAGLIFTLFIHFIVSVLSVYYSAMRLCSRQSTESIINDAILENAILSNNSTILSQERVENYIKSISSEQNLNGIPTNVIHKNMMRGIPAINSGNEKFDSLNSHEKLLALWLSQGKIKTIPTSHAVPNPSHHNGYNGNGHVHPHHHHPQQRPIVLVPAGIGNGYSPQPMMPLYQPSGSLPPPSIVYSTLSPASLPALAASGGTPPKSSSQPTYHYNQFNQLNYPPEILEQYNRMHRASTTPSKRNRRQQQQYQHLHQQSLYHQQQQQQQQLLANGGKPRRRKSDSEMENRKSAEAFIYTGLDRSIADSFLKQQEKINSNSVNNGSINNVRNDKIGKLHEIGADVAM